MRTSALLVLLAVTLSACGDARPAHEEARGPDSTPCNLCHGSTPDGAPPRALNGATDPSDPRVGAHRAHLDRGVACESCHVVPTGISSPGHIDEARASVPFGGVARAGEANPTYDRGNGTCSATWCHGRTGAVTPAPVWNGPLEGERCTSCHGFPPPRPHPPWAACELCHGQPPSADAPTVVAGSHLNGVVNASRVHPDGWVAPTEHGAAVLAGDQSCAACHGPVLLDPASPLSCAACHGGPDACASCHGAPPASGAHARHYTESRAGEVRAAYGDLSILADFEPQGADGYQFGCGHCHPLDPARHLNGRLEVELLPAGAAAGSLKARNAADAAYSGTPGLTPGSCSGVYCHSSGQQAPAFAATPRWDAVGRIACNGCHENPPRYASGAAGSATANSHVQLLEGGVVWGHFGGVGAHNLLADRATFPQTASRHGTHAVPGCETTVLGCRDAAPITCESCHAATVDRGGRAYYLDTTSDFTLPGGRVDERQCSSCHGAPNERAPAGAGAVRPLRHVNGQRDVVFDPLTAAPSPFPDYSPVPSGAYVPTLRYWMSGVSPNFAPPRDASQDGPLDPAFRTTISFHLASASYDAASKTCSNVGCHVRQTQVRWGTPYLERGCLSCH